MSDAGSDEGERPSAHVMISSVVDDMPWDAAGTGAKKGARGEGAGGEREDGRTTRASPAVRTRNILRGRTYGRAG